VDSTIGGGRYTVYSSTGDPENYLYSSPNIVWLIKSRRMRWTGHVARIEERRGYTGFWWENLKERGHLGDPGIDGRIILRWIIR
jgi:hypothetical protein